MIFNVPGHIDMIRSRIKTQTRRVNRGIYQVGKDYAVQQKRGVKAEEGVRIAMDDIWEEKAGLGFMLPNKIEISFQDAREEGNYVSFEYEQEFLNTYPKWDGKSRWAFKFHVIEVLK